MGMLKSGRQASFVALATALALSVAAVSAAEKAKKKSITKAGFDPAAEKVDLFDAMDAGQIEVTVLAKDEKQGNLLIENKTDKPLTVQMPDAFVGVPVLKQFGGGVGMGGIGNGGTNNGTGGNNNQQQQPFGGGLGGGLGGGGVGGFGGGGFGGGGLGGGFFSVPPEKTVRLSYGSVCLAHGKAEPRPRSLYKLVRVEQFTSDPALQELIRMVGTGRMDQQAAQAAAWHLADKMSWQDLARKEVHYLGGQGSQPYFATSTLQKAQMIVAQASASAKERGEKPTDAAKTEQPAQRNPRIR